MRRKREFPEAVPTPTETRRFLPALWAVVMPLAANAFRERQLVFSTPGKQPGFHVLMPDVMPGLDLPVCKAQLRQHFLLIGHVGLNCIGNEEV